MKVSSARVLFDELGSSITGVSVEVGMKRRPPHDYAYLKLTSLSSTDDFAVVWSPGDRWFMLDVPGGFGDWTIDEGLDDREVREILERYIRYAIAYLDGNRSFGKSRLFRIPHITVNASEGPLTLRLEAGALIRRLFRLAPILHETEVARKDDAE